MQDIYNKGVNMAQRSTITGGAIRDETIESADMASGSIKAAELNAEAISGQTLITSTDTTNDRLIIWDATDSALKQVSPGNLGVGGGSVAGSDTQVQYNNGGSLGGAAQLLYDDSNHRLGIGSTNAPDYTLDVAGNIGVDQYIYHNGDADTFIKFSDDDINLQAGGVNMIDITQSGNSEITFNESGEDVDFRVEGDTEQNLLFVDASTDRIGIGTSSPGTDLHVAGNDPRVRIDGDTDSHPGLELSENGTRKWIVFNDYTNDNLTFKTNSDIRVSIEQDGNVGVGTTSPKVGLDVMHDPTSLANDTGGGEVVTFGSGPGGSGSTTAGKLYYLDTDGQWEEADADALPTSGVLLAIALGTTPGTHGMLLRGFFDVHSYLVGTFNEGVPVYVSTTAGSISISAPSGAGDIVRIIGYCTTTANVIYFNPSNNTLELS